jgi:hypothetical protein
MKNLNENLIAGYIDGTLPLKKMEEIDKMVLEDKEFYNTVKDVITAKRLMDTPIEKELPWELTELVQKSLHVKSESNVRLVIKLMHNGLKEIFNSFNGEREMITYNVRGAVIEAPAFNYTHSTDTLIFNLYAYFEDNEHIRVKLEAKDTDKNPVGGKATLKFDGSHSQSKQNKNGTAEFASLKKGNYEILFEYEDVLSDNEKSNRIVFTLSLN